MLTKQIQHKTEHIEHNKECKSEYHDKHLCYLMSQGFNLSEPDVFKALINKPKYQCSHCNRKANSADNLCVPVPLESK